MINVSNFNNSFVSDVSEPETTEEKQTSLDLIVADTLYAHGESATAFRHYMVVFLSNESTGTQKIEALNRIANIYLATCCYDAAEQAFATCATYLQHENQGVTAERAEIFYKLGRTHYAMGKYREAAVDFKTSAEIYRQDMPGSLEHFEAEFYKSNCYICLTMNDQLLETIQSVSQLIENIDLPEDRHIQWNVLAQALLGFSSILTKNYAAGVDAFQTCYELDPSCATSEHEYYKWIRSGANSAQRAIDNS